MKGSFLKYRLEWPQVTYKLFTYYPDTSSNSLTPPCPDDSRFHTSKPKNYYKFYRESYTLNYFSSVLTPLLIIFWKTVKSHKDIPCRGKLNYTEREGLVNSVLGENPFYFKPHSGWILSPSEGSFSLCRQRGYRTGADNLPNARWEAANPYSFFLPVQWWGLWGQCG